MRMNSGRLPFNKEAYQCVQWQGPEEIGLDPQRDAASNIANLAAGLETMESLYHKRGMNWEHEIEQRAREVKRIHELAEEHGVNPALISTINPPGIVATQEKKGGMTVQSPGVPVPKSKKE